MTVSTSWSKQMVHSPFLPAGGSSEPETVGEMGGLRGELGAVTARSKKIRRTVQNDQMMVFMLLRGKDPRSQLGFLSHFNSSFFCLKTGHSFIWIQSYIFFIFICVNLLLH